MTAALFISCTREDVSSDGSSVRDSAGVRIVEYRSVPIEMSTWQVAQDADLSLGSLEGDRPDVFGRIDGVIEIANGSIIVADGLALELRAFDPSGAYLWTAGGRGEGPAEFANFTTLGQFGVDSIAVFDSRNSRVSVFNSGGGFARSYTMSLPDGSWSPNLAGITRDGALVGLFPYRPQLPPTPGVYQIHVNVLFFDSLGTLRVFGPSLPQADFLLPERLSGPVAPAMWLPLGSRTQLAVGSKSIAVTTQRRFEILRFDPSGAAHEIIRAEIPAARIDRDRYAELEPNRSMEFLPDSLPVIGRVYLDEADRLWVEEYVPPYEDRIANWSIFAPDGRLMARATMPKAFEPHTIRENHVLGVRKDSLGVAYVERRRIVR